MAHERRAAGARLRRFVARSRSSSVTFRVERPSDTRSGRCPSDHPVRGTARDTGFVVQVPRDRADRLRRADHLGDTPVGAGLSSGAAQRFPDAKLEGGAAQIERQVQRLTRLALMKSSTVSQRGAEALIVGDDCRVREARRRSPSSASGSAKPMKQTPLSVAPTSRGPKGEEARAVRMVSPTPPSARRARGRGARGRRGRRLRFWLRKPGL